MYEWFGKFVRGRAFAAIFCVLGLVMTGYLTLRLGMLLEAFTAVDLSVWIFGVLAALSAYMLAYVNSGKEEKRSWRLFNLCGRVLCGLISMVICFLLFDGVRLVLDLRDRRLYLIPLLLALALTGYGFAHAKKLRVRTYPIPLAGEEGGRRGKDGGAPQRPPRGQLCGHQAAPQDRQRGEPGGGGYGGHGRGHL